MESMTEREYMKWQGMTDAQIDGEFYVQELMYWLLTFGHDVKQCTRGDHYVYIALDGEDLVYVGIGTGDRYKHVTSGASHSKKLNSLHFKGVDLHVCDLVYGVSRDDAARIERAVIRLMSPSANSNLHLNNSFVRNYGSMLNAYLSGVSKEKVLSIVSG